MNRYLIYLICIIYCFFTFKNNHAQICHKYKLVPDTVLKNIPVTYEVQEATGGIAPPTLWVCNWIDFEGNGTHECDTSVSCSFTFTNSGLLTVLYEINEPFLNNTQVCTTMVFSSNCAPPFIEAKANGISDTTYVCENSQVILNANPLSGVSCNGNWEYSWFNGTTYYDGNGFLSFGEIWHPSFYAAQYDDIITEKLFTVKVRCSDLPICMDSSKVYVKLAYEVSAPIFNQPLPDTRCQGADTIDMSVTALNSDSIIYSVTPLISAYILDSTGLLILDSLYSGSLSITATAYGCYGPKSISHQLTTYPLADLFINSDTTLMCMGDTIFLPLIITGTQPFNIQYNTETQTGVTITSLSNNYQLPITADTSGISFLFYHISDNYCSKDIHISHTVLSSPEPVYNSLEDTTLCNDAAITLDLGNNPYTYLWLHDSSTAYFSVIDTSLSTIHIGSNLIFVSITNGYCNITDSIEITFTTCTDIQLHNALNNIFIYPNPARELLKIYFPFFMNKSVIMEIYNPIGNLLMCDVIKADFNSVTIPVKFNKGIYYIKLSADGYGYIIKKLIVN